jgi:hypothetical protein
MCNKHCKIYEYKYLGTKTENKMSVIINLKKNEIGKFLVKFC